MKRVLIVVDVQNDFVDVVLDRYIRTGEIDDMHTKERIDTMHEKNLFKLKPMPTFEYEAA